MSTLFFKTIIKRSILKPGRINKGIHWECKSKNFRVQFHKHLKLEVLMREPCLPYIHIWSCISPLCCPLCWLKYYCCSAVNCWGTDSAKSSQWKVLFLKLLV